MAEVFEWTNVTFTLGGAPFPVEHVAFTRKPYDPKTNAIDIVGLHPKYEAKGEFTCTLDATAGWGLLNLWPPLPRGASNMTLARRMKYGGRKGRSAWRRLRDQGFAGILTINDEPPIPCPPVRIMAAQFTRKDSGGEK